MSTERMGMRLYKDVVAIAGERLIADGFTRRSTGVFTCPIGDDESVGWLGLAFAKFERNGAHEIAPQVGIRHEPYERIYGELVPGGRGPRYTGTIGRNVGYATPASEYAAWRFSPASDHRDAVDEMLAVVAVHGVPHMESLRDPENLVKEFRRFSAAPQYQLPIALVVAGRTREAKELVSLELASLGHKTGSWHDFYRDFASRFFAHVRSAASASLG